MADHTIENEVPEQTSSEAPLSAKSANQETFLIRKHILVDNSDQTTLEEKCRWLLNYLKAWDEVDPIIKLAIEKKIIAFTATDPIPQDSEIEEKISIESALAKKQLALEREMNANKQIDTPTEIIVALKMDIEALMEENPEMRQGEVSSLAENYMNYAHIMIADAKKNKIFHIPGIRSIIAADVIRKMRTNIGNFQPIDNHSPIKSFQPYKGGEMADTIPGTPRSMRKKSG